jgi:hypothetical protein
LNVIGYGGNHNLEIKITDNGEPGNMDSIAITLYNSSGTLLMSGNWININTVQKKIANGNIQVSGVSASLRGIDPADLLTKPSILNVEVLPNPSPSQFTIVVRSNNETDPLSVRVINALGQVVEVKKNSSVNETFLMGANWKPGTYILEVVQGTEKRTVKLIRQTE